MSGIKTIVTVLVLAITLASYYAFASHSANYAAAATIMDNAQTIRNNWEVLTSSTGLHISQTTGKQLSPVLIRNHNALDWLVYGEHVMQDQFKEEFRATNIRPLMESIHVSSSGNNLHYGVGGARLNQFAIDSEGNTAVFYSEIYRPVLETLIKLYDNKEFDAKGSNTGVVRYGKLDGGEYAVGIYLDRSH